MSGRSLISDKINLFKFPSPTAYIIFCADWDYIHKAGFVSDVSDSRAKARTLAISYAKKIRYNRMNR